MDQNPLALSSKALVQYYLGHLFGFEQQLKSVALASIYDLNKVHKSIYSSLLSYPIIIFLLLTNIQTQLMPLLNQLIIKHK